MNRFFLFVVLLGLACSLVIEPSEERCSADEGCPTGMSCFDGICDVGRSCVEGTAEVCNGVDDDCDEIVDEEQGIEVCNGLDDDCDGTADEGLGATIEVCNMVDDDCDGMIDEGVPTMTDVCNDVDDDCDGVVDEGTAETCNNLDDDCDGLVDEEGTPAVSLCDEESICQGVCRVRSCSTDEALACNTPVDYCEALRSPPVCLPTPPRTCENDSQCEADQLCVEDIGACRDITPLGTQCTSDTTCIDGTFCANLEAIGIPGMNTCTNTCCDDDDCPNGAQCASTHAGARLCVLVGQVGAAIGAACDVHTDCTSGYCRNRSVCEERCSGDANCDSGDACVRLRVADDSSTNTTGCFNEGARRANGASCTESVQCQSYFCLGGGCRAACGAAGDCPPGEGCTSYPWMEDQRINICLTENPDGLAGRSCTVNGECDSLRCHNGSCVAPCCSDSTCTSGRVCRPIQTGNFWPTYCVPPNP